MYSPLLTKPSTSVEAASATARAKTWSSYDAVERQTFIAAYTCDSSHNLPLVGAEGACAGNMGAIEYFIGSCKKYFDYSTTRLQAPVASHSGYKVKLEAVQGPYSELSGSAQAQRTRAVTAASHSWQILTCPPSSTRSTKKLCNTDIEYKGQLLRPRSVKGWPLGHSVPCIAPSCAIKVCGPKSGDLIHRCTELFQVCCNTLRHLQLHEGDAEIELAQGIMRAAQYEVLCTCH